MERSDARKYLGKAFFLIMLLSILLPVQSAELDDATIFAIFDEVNTMDIWTARLAAQKGSTEEIRALGRKVAADHEAVQSMARALAGKLGIVPTPPPGDKSAMQLSTTIAMLGAKSGKDFDRAYLLHEAEFHANAIHAVKTVLLPALKNEEFKALIQKVAPGFQGHLEATRNLAVKLGYLQQ